ncbi:hypothetical protein PMAYCL1PPCAC_23031, partial [Pristionchus mayeri]
MGRDHWGGSESGIYSAGFLVDLLNGGSASGGTGSGGASWRSTGSLVQLGDDGVAHLLELLLLVLELVLLGGLVRVQPAEDLIALALDGLSVVGGDLVLELLVVEGLLHVEGVRLEGVLRADTLLLGIILSLQLLGIGHHLLDLVLRETSLVVGDGDLVLLSSGLVLGRDVEDTVGINVEGDLDLGHSTGRGRDARELELAEQVVVLGHGTLSLVHLDEYPGLVVSVGGEGLGGLGGDGGVALDKRGHHTTSSLDTERQRGDVEKEQVLDGLGLVSREDSSLDCGSVGNGLIGVDALVEFLSGEEVREELLDLGDTGGSSDKDDVVDGRLVHLGVSERLLDGVHRGTEEVSAKLLEASTSNVGVEVDSLEERVDLDRGLGRRGEGSLCALASGSQTAECTRVRCQILLVLSLELGNEVVDHAVVEVLSSEMGVSSSGLDLEDSVLNGEDGHIEGSSSEIEDEHVALSASLLVETVSDSGGRGLVDDSEHVEASDGTGVLGGLTLGVVEVSGDSDDGVLDGRSEEGLSGLLHLDEHHGGDLLGGERLVLSLVVDLHLGLATLGRDDLQGPVLHVRLDGLVVELASDESLGVEDGVVGVHGDLVLGGISDETLAVGESDIRGSSAVTLVVGDDLDLAVHEDTHARVGRAQIDSDCVRLTHFECVCGSE